ncbi:BrnT family toxin [Cyanobium sp. ULC084]
MEFAFDQAKSELNLAKHGIDFLAAQQLWSDSELLELPARTTGEPRFLVVGRIGLRHWSAVITYRDQCIRLISVRRSRPEEVELYEQF